MIQRLSNFHFPDSAARLYPETPERDWFVEVGFGDGRFWPQFAPTVGQANYLGVELSGVSLLKAERRLRGAGIQNAHLTKLPATPLIQGVVPSGALSGIIVNFPDPWPKAGHVSHRLLRQPFLTLAASRLQPGGAVWFTTDHEEYFEFACQEARDTDLFELEYDDPPPAALQTKYALKWRDLGLGAQHVRFRVKRHPAVPHLDVLPWPQEENQLPHAIITLPAGFDISAFEKATVRAPGHTIVLLDAYQGVRREELLVLAHVVEAELTQEVLISVVARADGTRLVRLERFGGPIITPGVKAAVGAVTDWLEGRGAQVKLRGY